MGKNVVFLPECHSTNDVASRLAEEGVLEGTIVITSNQTAGKGQRGNVWKTEPDMNLTLSIILHPNFLAVREQFNLNRAVALGIADCIRSFIPGGVQIKWPNDILVEGKKVCGVLIENAVMGTSLSRAIIGIGLNVNQQHFEFSSATSLGNVLQQSIDLEVVFEELVSCIESRYLALKAGRSQKIRSDYDANLFWKGEKRQFRSNGNFFEGTIIGDSDDGLLLLETAEGIRSFGVKEVEYVR